MLGELVPGSAQPETNLGGRCLKQVTLLLGPQIHQLQLSVQCFFRLSSCCIFCKTLNRISDNRDSVFAFIKYALVCQARNWELGNKNDNGKNNDSRRGS